MARLRSPSGLALIAAVVMVAMYFALRSPPPQETSRILITTWALAACALAVVSPRAGLVVLVGIGPFNETALFNEFLRAKTLIATFLLAGVIVRAVYAWSVHRRARASGLAMSAATHPAGGSALEPDLSLGASGRWSPPIERIFTRLAPLTHPALVLGLAALVVAGTGLSLWLVSLPVGEPFASRAATAWGGGIWTPFAAMFAAVWLGWRGDRTVLVVTAILGVASAVLGLLAYTRGDLFVGTPLAWIVERSLAGRRLVGVIDVPNAAATIFLGPTALLLCAAVFVRDLRVRLVAGVAGLVALVAIYLTLSRSALLAVALIVVIVALRYNRRVGLVVVAIGIVAVAVLLPRYLEQRSDRVPTGNGAAGVETLGDASRIRAWNAAILMWRDAPLTGQGFRTYQLHHEQYGEPHITAPHNEWLRFFAEEGTIIGLAAAAFVAFGALTLARARGWLASAILGTFLGYVLMASVNNPLTYVQVGLMVFPMIGIGLGLAWAARRRPTLEPATAPAGSAALATPSAHAEPAAPVIPAASAAPAPTEPSPEG